MPSKGDQGGSSTHLFLLELLADAGRPRCPGALRVRAVEQRADVLLQVEPGLRGRAQPARRARAAQVLRQGDVGAQDALEVEVLGVLEQLRSQRHVSKRVGALS